MDKLMDLNAEVARLNKKLLNQVIRVMAAKPSATRSNALSMAAKILEVSAPKAVSVSGRIRLGVDLKSTPARKFRSKAEAQRAIAFLSAAIEEKRVTISYQKKIENMKIKKTLDWVGSNIAVGDLDVRLTRRDALNLWELLKNAPSDSDYNYADVAEAYIQAVKIERQDFNIPEILRRAQALAPVVE